VINTKPESMVAAFFQSVRTPELKEWPKKADGTPDSLAAWRYMKDHFLGRRKFLRQQFDKNTLLRS
jgi:hypothetical protein